MTVKTSTKAPTKATIEAHTRDDLREVYLLAFDQFAVTPTDVTIYTVDRINSRYARELLSVLVQHKLLEVTDNGDGDVWQVIDPGTYDEHTEDEAKAVIDKWLDKVMPTGSAPATHPKGSTPKAPTPKAAKNPTGKCLCGCDENVAKSNYRPGHDARHAGNVARAIAADGSTETTSSKALLATLPSEKLQDKAEAMAERLIAKAAGKTKTAEPVPPPVVNAKVGRTTYEGVVDGDTFHYVDGKGDEKQAKKFTLIDA